MKNQDSFTDKNREIRFYDVMQEIIFGLIFMYLIQEFGRNSMIMTNAY